MDITDLNERLDTDNMNKRLDHIQYDINLLAKERIELENDVENLKNKIDEIERIINEESVKLANLSREAHPIIYIIQAKAADMIVDLCCFSTQEKAIKAIGSCDKYIGRYAWKFIVQMSDSNFVSDDIINCVDRKTFFSALDENKVIR